MTLNENSDRKLRKWCVEKVMTHGCPFGRVQKEQAEELFQYIKFGPDDGCGCCVDPDPCGPNPHEGSMSMLRKLADVDDGFHAS